MPLSAFAGNGWLRVYRETTTILKKGGYIGNSFHFLLFVQNDPVMTVELHEE